MSNVPSPVTPPPPARGGSFLKTLLGGSGRQGEVIVYHHSTLFYWWPVWLVGFIAALYTFVEGHQLAIVPPGTVALNQRQVEVDPGKLEKRDVLVLDSKSTHLTTKNEQGGDDATQPLIHMSRYRGIGTFYAAVLLLVIFSTNVPLRGLWSLLVLVSLILSSILLAVLGWWDEIFNKVTHLSIYINMGGYIVISTALFALWLFNLLVYDRQTYMIFSEGQVRLRLEIGGGETVYDTTGMIVQKQRSDLFRHVILGFGSGDLIIHLVSVGRPIELPNVLNVGSVVTRLEGIIKEKVVLPSEERRN